MCTIEGEVMKKEDYAFTLEANGVVYIIKSRIPLPGELAVHDRVRVVGEVHGDTVDELSGFCYLKN